MKELISQPILLHMVAVLQGGIDLKANRAQIYDNLYTQLINRSWDKEGPIDGLQGLTKDSLREFLREIAFAIFVSGKEYIHKSTLSNLPATKLFIQNLDNTAFKDSLKRIMIAFYFQETKKDKSAFDSDDQYNYAIEFLHKSLQEYLVAEKIWRSILEFVEKKSGGRYVIDQDEQALLETSKIFSTRLMTEEVRNYLEEIISNDCTIDKSELCIRLEKFFPYCLDQQFYTRSAEMPNTTIHSAFSNCYGYWFIMSHLNQNRNLIPPSHKDKFAWFLKLLDGENTPINLSWQNLSTTYLEGTNFNGANLSFGIFKRAVMNRCSIERAHLEETDFSYAELKLATFEGTNLKKTNFKASRLVQTCFEHASLSYCNFYDSNCYAASFAYSKFEGIIFDLCIVGNAVFERTHNLNPEMFVSSRFYSEVFDFSRSLVKKIELLKKEKGIPLDKPVKKIK